MNLNLYKKRKGFTLIELVVVLAILSIITLIGTMGYGMIQDRIKIKSDKSTGALIGKELVAREMDVSKGKKIAVYPQVTVYDTLESIESYLDKGTIPESMEEGKFIATAIEVEENVTKIMVGIGKENETIPWQVYNDKETPGWLWAEDMEISEFLRQYAPEDEEGTNDWNTADDIKNEYAVQYDKNASETVTNMPGNQVKLRGTNLILSEKIPVRENYTFKNWNTKADGKGTSYTPGEIYIRNEDIELCAQWKADEYEVELDHQSEIMDGTESITVEYGSPMPAIQIPKRNYTVTFNYGTDEIANSTKTAVYTFGGYYTDINGFGTQYYTETGKGVTIENAKERNWDIPSDTTLYAKWTETNVELPSPSRAGYGFSGWFTEANGGIKVGEVGENGKTFYTPTENITLYAHWAEGQNTVTLNNQGATSAGTTSVTATYGQAMPNITRPVRQYTVTFNYNGNGKSNTTKTATYVFDGYYTEENGEGTEYYTSSGVSARNWDRTENITLSADWAKTSIELPEAIRAGYGFSGWYTASNGGTRVGGKGERYTPTADIILYAQWGAEEGLVVLDSQGATTPGTGTIIPTYGDAMPSITVPIKQYSVEFDYGGNGQANSTQTVTYEFGGYYTDTEGSGVKYYNANGTSARTWDRTENITLYAEWLNGNITLPTPNARTGYRFKGWYTASSMGEKIGEAGNTYKLTRNIVLYGQWEGEGSTVVTLDNQGATVAGTTSITPVYGESMPEIQVPVKKYNITYDYNGSGQINNVETIQYLFEGYYTGINKIGSKQYYTGTGASANIWEETEINKLYASWETKSAQLPPATREGYRFNGWYTASSGGTRVGGGEEAYTPTENITLYAQWGINSYEITLNNKGATIAGTTTVMAEYDKVLDDITPPTKEYTVTFNYNTPAVDEEEEVAIHQFTGYYTQGGEQYYGADGKGVKNWDIASDTMLYAKWITTNANVVLKEEIARPGYIFEGWYTNDIGGIKIGDTGTIYTPSEDITLYAHWRGRTSIVTLDNQGATIAGTGGVDAVYGDAMPRINTPARSYTVTFNKNMPNSNNITQNATYTFEGYYTGTGGTGTPYYNGDGTSARTWNRTEDTTLYANWTGGSVELPHVTREGYGFGGWFTATIGGTKIGNDGDTYTPTGNITLYAQWGAGESTVTLNNQGATTAGTASVTATYGLDMPEISVPEKAYTVTYNYNGGTGTPASEIVEYVFGGYYTGTEGNGSAYYGETGASTRTWDRTGAMTLYAKWTERSVKLPSATRTGYTFDGWYDAVSEGNKVGEIGDSYTPTTNKTLYAHWVANEYAVLLDSNEATTSGTTSVVATYDSPMPTPIVKPAKVHTVTLNYMTEEETENKVATGTFNGYYLDTSNPETQYYTGDVESERNWNKAENEILYAKWTEGTVTLTTPSKPYYTFVGWYTDETWGTKAGNGGENYTPTEDITLYAQWAKSAYDITLNGQGATTQGTTGVKAVYGQVMPTITKPERKYTTTFNYNMEIADSSQTVKYDFMGYFTETNGGGTKYYGESGSSMQNWDRTETTTLYAYWLSNSLILPTPSRTGYTFDGWYDATSGGNKIGDAGASYTPTQNKTIYAHWNARTYTVTLDQQDATTNGTTSATATYDAAMPEITAPSRAYTVTYNYNGGSGTPANATATYTFVGYFQNSNLTGTQYYTNAGASNHVWDQADNATIYAKWTSASVTLPTPNTRTGYTFDAWYDAASGGNKIGNAGASYTPTQNKTIYAHWTANTYTVTLNQQDATTTGTTSVTATYDSAMPTPITKPQRAYTVTYNYNGSGQANGSGTATYTFVGYFQNSNLTGTQYYTNAGASNHVWDQADNATIYAKWTSASVTLPTPNTRTGYTFDAWYDAASGGNKIGNAGASYTPTQNKTIYAQWTANELTFSNQSRTVYYNTESTQNAAITAATNGTGTYTYSISSQKNSGGTAVSSFSISGTNVVTAKSTAAGVYTVVVKATDSNSAKTKEATYTITVAYPALTLDGNGTTAAPATVTKTPVYTKYATVNEYTTATGSTAATIEATRTGYTLNGWYTAASGGTKVLDASGNGTGTPVTNFTNASKQWVMTAPQTLYAQWTQTYTISYNANGGSGAPAAQTKTQGVALTLTTSMPTKSGNMFNGWNTAANGSGTSYGAGESYTTDAAVTLYAQWITTPTVGSYVCYNGGGYTDWRIIRNTQGAIELVSTDSVADKQISSDSGYVNFVQILNNMCQSYLNSTYAVSARSAGATSESVGVLNTSQYPLVYGANGFPYADNFGDTDQYLLTYSLPAATYNKNVWIASRGIYGIGWTDNTYSTIFAGKYAPSQSEVDWENNYYNTYGEAYTSPEQWGKQWLGSAGSPWGGGSVATYGVRPIITLKPGVRIVAGSGTAADPYALNVQGVANPYAVTYNANGGSGAPNKQYKYHGETLKLSSTTPTKSGGYVFIGWNTAADGSGTSYAAGGNYTANAALTLYAQWQLQYTVTYYDVSGINVSGMPGSQIKVHNVNLTLSTAVPTATNCIFTGWNTDRYGNGTAYAPGATYTGNANLTLYAQWGQAQSVLTVGKYVSYSGGSYTGQWVVLKNSNGVVELLSRSSVGTVTLQGKTGYLNAVQLANDVCAGVLNTTYATSVRTFGTTSDSQGQLADAITLNAPYNETYYTTDYNIMISNMNLRYTSGSYAEFIGSRYSQQYGSSIRFGVYTSTVNGTTANQQFLGYSPSGSSMNATLAVRAVVTLKTDLAVIGGTGSSGSPYTLGVGY